MTAADGSVAQSYTYDSFGNQTASSGSLTNFFRYTGREFDTETNLYYYRARYYDPAAGRFLSEDPFGFLIDVNFYRYTMNRPINLIDPLGLCWIYQQSTGKIYYNPDLSSPSGPSVFPDDLLSEYSIYGPNAVYIGQGYSGFGEGLNNPALADYPDLGPIPIGFYTIGPQQLNITSNGIRLPGSMRLTPSPNNQMFNRNGFLIHGANQYATPTESSGCPVVRPAIRNKIGKSKDPCLVVVP